MFIGIQVRHWVPLWSFNITGRGWHFKTSISRVWSAYHSCRQNSKSHAYKIFESVRRRTSGFTFTYINDFTPDTLKAAIKENTRLIWVESIVRPLFAMPNLKLIADFSKANDLISVCDNTLATPHLLKPIQFGFDIVVYDAVGYLSGRTDIDGGCAVVAKGREFIQEKLGFLQLTIGSTLPAIEQEQLCIAFGTMKIRIDQQSKNAESIAKFLEGHERVEKVYYLGLEAHSHHAYGNEKLTNFGGAFSVTFSDDVNVAPGLQKKLNVFTISEIIGGPMSRFGIRLLRFTMLYLMKLKSI